MDLERCEKIEELRRKYHIKPRWVMLDWWNNITADFPALLNHPDSLFLREMLQYVLYSSFRCQRTSKRVVPRDAVAALAQMHPDQFGFAAANYLDLFSRLIFPLNASGWTMEEARTIEPEFPAGFHAAWVNQARALRRGYESAPVVNFVTGEYLGIRKKKAMWKEYESYLDTLLQDVDEDHPAFPLILLLNGSGQFMLRKYVRRNWEAMNDWMDGMPLTTDLEKERGMYVEARITEIISDGVVMRYGPVENSPRLFAKGSTINCLPRELRDIALRGTVGLDLKAAQLAIISKLYGCPKLHAFLSDPHHSIWKTLIDDLGLSLADKDLLKSAVYALVFGAKATTVSRIIARGELWDKGDRIKKLFEHGGLGRGVAQNFMAHPLIAEIVERRQAMMERACAAGGMEDAFGRWLSLPYREKTRKDGTTYLKAHPASLLANVVQSYEVKLMMAFLEVVEDKQAGCTIVSFVHDGVYLHFTEKDKQHQKLKRIKDLVKAQAQALDMPTEFEEKHL